MGDLSEFSRSVRLFLRAYRWRRIDPVPWAPLSRPLSRCRLALVSSAGLVPPGQPRFDDGVRGGDPSFRVIPGDVEVGTLVDAHKSDSYDHSGVATDFNLAFPLDRLRELARSGRTERSRASEPSSRCGLAAARETRVEPSAAARFRGDPSTRRLSVGERSGEPSGTHRPSPAVVGRGGRQVVRINRPLFGAESRVAPGAGQEGTLRRASRPREGRDRVPSSGRSRGDKKAPGCADPAQDIFLPRPRTATSSLLVERISSSRLGTLGCPSQAAGSSAADHSK